MKKAAIAALAAAVVASVAGAVPSSSSSAAGTQGYLVVLAGTQGADGFAAPGSAAALRTAVAAAGGTIANDLSKQIGVLYVHSAAATFASALSASSLVESVGADFGWQGISAAAPEPVDDPLESEQWDMQQIRTDEAHAIQGGIRAVDVGVLDTGIDGYHHEFRKGLETNVDCARGRNSIAFLPTGPGVGNPDPCVDNQFHGTHVAGTIAARANGEGFVGVAPNVTLVPVKVCDSSGLCYASAAVDGITYAGDQRFDVINMSFFVDATSSSSRRSSSAWTTRCRRRSGRPWSVRSSTPVTRA
ncbi:MAG: S8 family serine peptidase [Gaiellaceae bacterium]